MEAASADDTRNSNADVLLLGASVRSAGGGAYPPEVTTAPPHRKESPEEEVSEDRSLPTSVA